MNDDRPADQARPPHSQDQNPQRSIEFEIEVQGTPEEVWQAIATGPGISSWYVPHEIEEREGGAVRARFGPGSEMQVDGRVAAWEPPNRFVIDGGEGVPGLAFEWLIETRSGDTCIVRLVNTGFGSEAEWDDQYDGMTEGWKLFLLNLQLHLQRFRGRTATAMLPTAPWPGSRIDAWSELNSALGISRPPAKGDHLIIEPESELVLSGTVVDVAAWRLALSLDQPAEGTAFLAAETVGGQTGVSVWAYLYGTNGSTIAARDEPRWQAWLSKQSAASNGQGI